MNMFRSNIRVEGKGDSKQTAINKALYKIQKTVMKKFPDSMILRIEPFDVTVIQATEKQFTERFLLFFFRRTRSIFHVVLEVEVNVSLLEVGKIPFVLKMDEQKKNLKKIVNKIGGEQ
ncbi:DUF4312 family protein [Sporolactobacillus inulinus]|uniref:DUF4312 family protein n=1 Tax=Sporolactobacillus inulinus TaxID=2078 RepID=UPI001141B65A|nr:DUF4312 family protein [Sporolactobacillus inulinus]GEB76297.1 hypothetical protein SIN01_06420 [Sporolactobacillus inulinus]